jgi:signal transduction histidine kinase/ligand-binding sensor domain-containing protein/DNA-binding NarL/FixJ family response regulator
MKVSCIYFYVALLCIPFAGLSQLNDLRFQHINATSGLSHGFTRKVLRDSKGYMWFATANGLNKFDGSNVTIYRNDKGDPHSLSSNELITAFEDSYGNLWVGASAGINRYVRELDRFERYSELEDDFINSIYEDHDRNVWVSARTALYKFISSKNIFEKVELKGSEININAIFEDSNGTFWIGMLDYIAVLDREHHQLIQQEVLGIKNISCFYEDIAGNLWMGAKGLGILKIDKQTGKKTLIRKELGNVNGVDCDVVLDINGDDQGNIWIGTENGGLIVHNPSANTFKHYLHNPSNPESLCFNSVYSITIDRNKNLWLGTFTGVELLKHNKFNHIRPDLSDKHGLSSNYILTFCEDYLGNIWIGTDGDGLEKYDRKTGTFTHFKHSVDNPNSLAANAVTYLYEDKLHNLWIGTWSGGLDLYDHAKNKFIHFKPDRSDIKTIENENIVAIHEDRRSNLWIGTGSGIDLFQRETRTFNHYNFPNTLMSSFPGDILEDKHGNLWVGAYDGLGIFDRETKTITTYRHHEDDSTSLCNNVVHTLFEDSRGNLWIGTSSGLSCYNHQTKTFKSYYQKDGLPSDAIYGILEDAKGSFWISTSNGISKFDQSTRTFKNYNMDDGLQGNEFKPNSFCKLRSGEMLFGGDNGFNIFNPDNIQDDFTVPTVVLTDFKIFNKSVPIGTKDSPLQKHISEVDELVLSYKNSVISFDFTALSFASPGSNAYAYKLEGLEKDWNYVGNKREATYTNLDPGSYTLRIIASNNDGIWNKEGKSLKIIITPPFWKTWWFRLFALVVFAIIINVFIRFRINRYKRQKKILQKIVERKTMEISSQNKFLESVNLELSKQKEEILAQKEEILDMSIKVKEADDKKLNFFTNISHEFRTPLTLILGPARNLINKMKDNKMADELNIIHKNAHRLLFLVNELMDFHKIDNNQMKLQVVKTDLIKFFSDVVYTFDELAAQKEIELIFLPSVPQYDTWLDLQKMEIILYNLISNAFKFTPEGGKIKLNLYIKEEENELEIIVEDNGIGIEQEKIKYIFNRYYQVEALNAQYQGTGIGLAHTKELILLMEGTIEVFSKTSKGTAFIIRLPILKDERVKANGKITTFQTDSIAVSKELFAALKPVDRSAAFEERDTLGGLAEIVVIDDNDDIRNYVRACLIEKFNVTEAVSGVEGLVLVKEKLPKLVICDVMMPKMNGFEFCKQLKSDLETSHIPVILLTAKANVESQIEGFEIGADDYVTKPFTQELLISRIENLIQGREKLRNIFRSKIELNPNEISVTSADENFLLNVLEIVEHNIDDADFGVAELVEEMGISKSVVNRKLKNLTDLSTAEFIKTTRLKRAAQLLKDKKHRISDVCYMVGFNDPHYFGKAFRSLFGVSPSQYQDAQQVS